jgi:hypothetical protein
VGVEKRDQPQFLATEFIVESKLGGFPEFQRERAAPIITKFMMEIDKLSFPDPVIDEASPDGPALPPTSASIAQAGHGLFEETLRHN